MSVHWPACLAHTDSLLGSLQPEHLLECWHVLSVCALANPLLAGAALLLQQCYHCGPTLQRLCTAGCADHAPHIGTQQLVTILLFMIVIPPSCLPPTIWCFEPFKLCVVLHGTCILWHTLLLSALIHSNMWVYALLQASTTINKTTTIWHCWWFFSGFQVSKHPLSFSLFVLFCYCSQCIFQESLWQHLETWIFVL